jgi:adenosylmethionine-8-amino-7-oxononanoate aminotransferase
MKLFREKGVVESLPAKAAALGDALAPLADHPRVGEIRRRGLMVGIELVRDRSTKEAYFYEARAGHRVCMEARALGAILRPLGNVVVLMPPLAMTPAQLAELSGIAAAAIERATAKLDRELSA